MNNSLVLVTGVTGYIGGRLAPQLIEAGYRVRVMVRDRNRLQGRAWLNQMEVVQADVLDAASLLPVMPGVHAAYYLIHSMSGSADFDQRDLQAARNFGDAACLILYQKHKFCSIKNKIRPQEFRTGSLYGKQDN